MFVPLLLLIGAAEGARILGVIPTASYSHQIPWRPLWRQLHANGHHLTILTTDPMRDPLLTNLTEIDLHFLYQLFEENDFTPTAINESLSLYEKGVHMWNIVINSTEAIFRLPDVRRLISEEQRFDLVLVEAGYISMLGFVSRFNCPWISISSLDGSLFDHYVAGNSLHPVLYPEINFQIAGERMSFMERVMSTVLINLYVFGGFRNYFNAEQLRLVHHFGEGLGDLREIHRNMSLMFIVYNSVLFNSRPMGPNTITVGHGMHINKERDPMPKELQEFLDKGTQGVIYFSLGSNIKAKLIKPALKQAFVTALSSLPYRVLWKLDEEILNLPSSIKLVKWLPQQDVLRHPNIKVFVTQAGLQSLQEALTNFVPMVCVPFFGDQLQNAQRMALKGVAVRLSLQEINANSFKLAILEVATNSRYKERAKELGEILHDEPSTGIEKAVWWTEYVIRHKGAKHLKNPGLDFPFYQYYLLDAIAFIVGVIMAVLILLFTIFWFIFKGLRCGLRRLLCKKQKRKKE